MSRQTWDWRKALTTEERAEVERLEKIIKWLDDRRLMHAAMRERIQKRAQKRARVSCETMR